MRFLIVLIFIGVQSIAQDAVTELESRYFKKADSIKQEYEDKSLKLAKEYIRALEVIKVRETKKGNLEGATTAKNKIEEIKNQLPKESNDIDVVTSEDKLKSFKGVWDIDLESINYTMSYEITDTDVYLLMSSYKNGRPYKKKTKVNYSISNDGNKISLEWIDARGSRYQNRFIIIDLNKKSALYEKGDGDPNKNIVEL